MGDGTAVVFNGQIIARGTGHAGGHRELPSCALAGWARQRDSSLAICGWHWLLAGETRSIPSKPPIIATRDENQTATATGRRSLLYLSGQRGHQVL
jgi:hypothetical protein